ncbi:MAG: DUF11 domain-containing protein, partial [Bacteroidota bacterium]
MKKKLPQTKVRSAVNCYLLILPFLFFLFSLSVFAEGTPTLSPNANNITAVLSAPDLSNGSYFNAPEDNRIYFNIANASTENLYFGFDWREYATGNPSRVNNLYYRIRRPDGTVAVTALWNSANGVAGSIDSHEKALAGPNIGSVTTGYTPLIFDPTVSGEHWIEIYRSNDGGVTALTTSADRAVGALFDMTVANNSGSFGKKSGRLHSDKWGFVAVSSTYGNTTTATSESNFYAYTDDKVVLFIDFNPGFQPIAFNVAVNSYGVSQSGGFNITRRSINAATSPSLLNGFKVFLNNPDSNLYPIASVPAAPTFLNPAITNCGPYLIRFNISEAGDVKLFFDLNGVSGYQNGTSDRIIEAFSLPAGNNSISWDGLDGLGNVVNDGSTVNLTLNFLKGRFNLPLYDVELNTNGFNVSSIAPIAIANSQMFWDDSQLTNVGLTCLTDGSTSENNITGAGLNNSFMGTTSPARAWSANGNLLQVIPAPANGANETDGTTCNDYGNVRLLNTWGWGLASASVSTNIFKGCSDLKVVKTVSNSNPTFGSDVTFTITASNLGVSNDTNVIINDAIPNGYTIVSVTPSRGTWSAPNWTIGNFAKDATATLTVVAKVKKAGIYANTATISGTNADPVTENNTSTSTPVPGNSVIIAADDTTGPINGVTGQNNVLNVLTNDTLNNVIVTASSVILTTITPSPYLVLNANGSVNVLAGTPNGIYNLTYQICETVNPTNCTTAIATVSVNDGTIACNTIDPIPFTSSIFDGLTVSTSTSGLCVLGCGISNSSRLIDTNLTNYATATSLIGVGVTHNLKVTDGNTSYLAGTFAGFRIAPSGGLISVDLLNSISIKTYLAGSLQETYTGSSLVNLSLLSNPGNYVLGFNTKEAFDAIEISMNSLAGVLSSTNIYYPVISTYCAGPALECNVPTAVNYPTFPTTIQNTHTGLSGISIGSVTDAENAISASTSDYASLNLLVGVAGSVSLAVKDQVTDYPAGTYAGFEIENTNLVSVSVLGNLQIKTYLNGVLKDQFSGSNLLVNGTLLNSTGRYKIGFVSTQPFDEVQISINQVIGVNLGLTKVYNAVFERFCAGPDLACNTPVAVTAPIYPVFINGPKTGIDGLVCVLCDVSNTENLIDTNTTNFAQINLTASVGTSGKISVKNQITDYPAGTFAGFDIENNSLLSVNAFDAIIVTTYLNGVQQETKTGNGALISVNTNLLVGTGRQTVGFVSTLPFDEVQIKLTNLVSVNLGTTKVYNAVFQKFCPTTVECNNTYALTSPIFPVSIDGANSGISGVACVACGVNNTSNILTSSNSDFANISITAGVLASGSIAVADQLFTYPSGTYAGFTIKDLNSLIQLNLFNTLTISTYNNGILQETKGGSELINLTVLGTIFINPSTSGIYNVGIKATLPFDQIKIKVSSLVSVINNINVYGAFVNTKDSNDGGSGSLSCASSNLSITKTVNNSTPKVGSNVTFTILAANAGTSDATGVVVYDILPSGYTYLNSTVSTGTYNNTTGVWTIGNLNNGSNETLTITATVKATGNFSNTATITGNQPDPNPNNNTSTSTPTPVNVIDAVDDAGTPVNGFNGGT